jgi:hypothetical protein
MPQTPDDFLIVLAQAEKSLEVDLNFFSVTAKSFVVKTNFHYDPEYTPNYIDRLDHPMNPELHFRKKRVWTKEAIIEYVCRHAPAGVPRSCILV